MSRARFRALLAGIVALILLGIALLWWAATAAPDTPTQTGPETASPSSTQPPTPAHRQPAPTTSTTSTPGRPAAALQDAEGDPAWSTPTSTQAAAAQATADAAWVARAAAFAAAYARPAPGVDRGTWWGRVKPLLTDTAATDYADVDPARVRYTQVTGAGAVVEPPTDAVDVDRVQVGVPTDAGWYVITLDLDGLVTQIVPIGDVQVAGR